MAALRVLAVLTLFGCGAYPQARFAAEAEGGTGGELDPLPGGSGGGAAGGGFAAEDCASPGDEDGNGRADCADEACFCPPVEEDCGSPVDEDGDGLPGCDDPDCAEACGEQVQLVSLGTFRPGEPIAFDVPDGALGFTLVAVGDPFSPYRFARIDSPAGVELLGRGLRTEESLEAVGLVIPASDDPAFALVPGRWDVELDASAPANVTLALRLADPSPRVLDVDVYVPNGLRACPAEDCSGGAAAVSAATAPGFAEVEGILTTFFEDVYVPAGFTRGEIRYTEIASRFSSVSDQSELDALFRESAAGRPRALQVMLVQQLPLAEISGIAASIPGALGTVGNRTAGVAVQVQLDGRQRRNLGGLVLAHEAGHLLGLYHTTERDGQTDLVLDTPSCPGINNRPDLCPDFENPMFPFLTDELGAFSQGQVIPLRAGPLHREAR